MWAFCVVLLHQLLTLPAMLYDYAWHSNANVLHQMFALPAMLYDYAWHSNAMCCTNCLHCQPCCVTMPDTAMQMCCTNCLHCQPRCLTMPDTAMQTPGVCSFSLKPLFSFACHCSKQACMLNVPPHTVRALQLRASCSSCTVPPFGCKVVITHCVFYCDLSFHLPLQALSVWVSCKWLHMSWGWIYPSR